MSGLATVSSPKSLAMAAASTRKNSGARTISVAIYLHDLAGGGVERQSLIIAEEFRRCGIEVTLLLHRLRGQLLDQIPSGLRVVDLESNRTLTDVSRLMRFLRAEKPDILLANLDLNNIAALLAKAIALSGTKVIICQHNPMTSSFVVSEHWLYRYVGLSYRLLSPLISRAVGVSVGVAAELTQTGGLPKDRVVTINNPVVGPDFADRCSEAAFHPWFGVPGRPVFVTAGRLVPQKDHDTMLRAFALHRQRFDSRLIILGTGPLHDALRDLTRQLGLTETVDFVGFHSNVLPFFRQADAFVMSSRCEGFGNVLVEALGCGTPVISSRCEHGPAEILDGGRYGLLAEPQDPQSLAAAMDQIGTLRERFPAEMLRLRAAEYSYAACATKYMTVFKALAPNWAWAV